MKNIGLLLCSITGFFIILGCLFYNSLLIDMDKIKDYVTESNYIFEQVVKNEDKVDDNKGEYISRFLFEKYKKIKISSIELLIDLINENNEKDKKNYLKLILKSNDRSQRELDSMMNKGFIEVTYLCLKTYINL